MTRLSWDMRDDGVLTKYYPSDGLDVVQRILRLKGRRRTRRSIICRASKLGIIWTNWTGREDWILEKCYPTFGARYCQKYLTKRSLNAIRDRARRLGLRNTQIASEEQVRDTDHLAALAWTGIRYRG